MPDAHMRRTVWLSGAAISLSAFLLFSLEPLIAKQILPWFGGSAAVWSTCLVFYQLALLGGYGYAMLLTRKLSPRAQSLAHCTLLGASLLLLPVGPGLRWEPTGPTHPSAAIFTLLIATIALPFALLSSTGPLLQSWLSRRGYAAPYALFAVSNAASLGALLAYPFLIEPHFSLKQQRVAWSVLYIGAALLIMIVARPAFRAPRQLAQPLRFTGPTRLAWFAFAACGSALLLAITNHITQNVAAVPLLWVVPLAIYLVTFILAFARRQLYSQAIWLRILAMALGLLAYAIADIQVVEAIQISLPVALFALFAGCFFCHAELNRLRPAPEHLAEFYLAIAGGGAAGAVSVGLVAPQIFGGIYEMPLALAFTAALAAFVMTQQRSRVGQFLWITITAAMLAVFALNVRAYREHSLVLERSFYGSLRVVQTPLVTESQTRTLFHGTIKHGEEFLWPALRNRPTTYYGPDSGIGIVLRDCYPAPKRVAVIGLGTGTVAAYGHKGDTYRFFEINEQAANIAQSLFYFLRSSPAHIDIALGDGRLLLAHDTQASYDVIILDAFSGDAVPVHLLTREALALYKQHLAADGTIAFHVSNQYLDLAAVLSPLAANEHLQAVEVRNHQDLDTGVEAADWVLLTNNPAVLQNSAIRVHTQPTTAHPSLRPWTDEDNSLLQVFKTPSVRY